MFFCHRTGSIKQGQYQTNILLFLGGPPSHMINIFFYDGLSVDTCIFQIRVNFFFYLNNRNALSSQ